MGREQLVIIPRSFGQMDAIWYILRTLVVGLIMAILETSRYMQVQLSGLVDLYVEVQ
jgi:hypothetical protein